MLKELKNLVAFLTVLPVGMDADCLYDAANYMYLFPLVGAFIGMLGGVFAWLLLSILNASIAGILTVGVLLMLTGLHHTDGLLDFGDALMYQGSPERKIEIMHDQQTGAGGLVFGVVTILATALCIAQLNYNLIVQSIIVAEVSAKLVMVVMARVGRSAHEGMNTHFVNVMHGKRRNFRLIAALFISFGIASVLLRVVGFVTVVTSLAVALILTVTSDRHFNGVTGDVFGAGNELARLASLIAIVMVVRWA
jgi:adenosylcobinamide-GDP ribazoletransferase